MKRRVKVIIWTASAVVLTPVLVFGALYAWIVIDFNRLAAGLYKQIPEYDAIAKERATVSYALEYRSDMPAFPIKKDDGVFRSLSTWEDSSIYVWLDSNQDKIVFNYSTHDIQSTPIKSVSENYIEVRPDSLLRIHWYQNDPTNLYFSYGYLVNNDTNRGYCANRYAFPETEVGSFLSSIEASLGEWLHS